jgi:GDPmannose 4,6-dehydratase
VRIANGSKEKLTLAWLDIRRDWGWAPDYVEAMRRMRQQKKPDDYVVATGEEHSLQQFVNEAFRHLGLDWKKHVVSDRKLFRPSDIERSCGNLETGLLGASLVRHVRLLAVFTSLNK